MNNKRELRKIKWTNGMGFLSFGIFVTINLLYYLREPLLGIIPGYAPHNYPVNLLSSIGFVLSFILSIVVIIRTIKHRNDWEDGNKKYIRIGLALPALISYLVFLVEIFSI